MIQSLTKKQEDNIAVHRDEYLNKFYSLPRLDGAKAESVIKYFYSSSGLKEPIVWLYDGSPFGLQIIANVVCGNQQNIGQNIWQNIGQNIEQNIRQNIGQNIRQNIEQYKLQYFDFGYYLRCDDYSWIAYYDYLIQNKLITVKNDGFDKMREFADSGIYATIQMDGICFVCANPVKLNLDNQKRLHSKDDYAIQWSDGWGLHALNGVIVPQWIVETPTHQLKASDINRDEVKSNVEVRREFVRKIGIERVTNELGWTVIDKRDTYELGTLEVVEGSKRVYLKMLNPSVEGVWHIEAVHPECSTVQEAINWRAYGDKNKHWEPIHLS